MKQPHFKTKYSFTRVQTKTGYTYDTKEGIFKLLERITFVKNQGQMFVKIEHFKGEKKLVLFLSIDQIESINEL